MSISVKRNGAYVAVSSVKVKRAGAYLDASVFAKLGGAYQSVSGGGGGAPVNTVPPVIIGAPEEGQTVSVTTGTWTNSPTGYTYQWKRNGADMAAATSNTYLLVSADVGTAITCVVTATNGSGSASVTTAAADTVYAATPFYFNDFTYADGTLARNLPGWNAWDAGGVSANSNRDNLRVFSNRLGFTGSDFTATPGAVVIGYEAGSADQVARITVPVIPTSGEIIFCISSTSSASALYVSMVNSGGINNVIFKTSGGVTLGTINLPIITFGRALQSGDILELRTPPGEQKIHAFINQIRITTDAGISLGSFVKGTRAGWGTFNSGSVSRFDDFRVASIAGNIQLISPNVFVPGSIAGGGRVLPIAGSYSGSVLAVDYQVLNASTFAVIQGWQRIPGATISGGVWSGNAFVPLSDNVTNPRCLLQVRAANDTDVYDTSTAFAVGAAWAFWGQSNSENRGGIDAALVTGSPTVYALTSGGSPDTTAVKAWKKDTTATGFKSAAFAFGEKMSSLIGVPCGMFIMGFGAQAIDSLIPTSTVMFGDRLHPDQFHNAWFYNTYHLDTTLTSGYIVGWCWTQGEAEAFAPVVDISGYKSPKFSSLISAFAPYCLPNPTIAIAIIGKYTGTVSAPDQPSYNTNAAALRKTLAELARDTPNAVVAHSFVDIPMIDNYHYTADGYYEANRRAALSFAKANGLIAYDGQGPLVTGATRSGAVITLAVDLNGATGISGTALTGYEASTDGFVTTKTISSAAVVSNAIVLTLAADPGAAVQVRSFAGYNYDNSSLAIGAYADGTSIATMPITIPIASN